MAKVNVHDAKTQFSRLLERAHGGEEITIAKNGEPYAKLVPLDVPKPRQPGSFSHLRVNDRHFDDPLPSDELDAWEGS